MFSLIFRIMIVNIIHGIVEFGVADSIGKGITHSIHGTLLGIQTEQWLNVIPFRPNCFFFWASSDKARRYARVEFYDFRRAGCPCLQTLSTQKYDGKKHQYMSTPLFFHGVTRPELGVSANPLWLLYIFFLFVILYYLLYSVLYCNIITSLAIN